MRYRAIGGAHGGRGRELGDGNVVGMPVSPLRTESDDHMGLNAPDVRNDGANRKSRPGPHQRRRPGSSGSNLADAEHRGGSPQLRFTNSAYFNRIPGLSE